MIIGIDPGKHGGVAVLHQDCTAEVIDMPTLTDFADFIRERKDNIKRVFIEKQQVFSKIYGRKQGAVSSGNLMKHYGELIGVLTALQVPFEEIPPKRWQAVIFGTKHKKRPRTEKKKKSIEKAKQMFPFVEIRKKDGRAEALLIAEYGRNLMLGGKYAI